MIAFVKDKYRFSLGIYYTHLSLDDKVHFLRNFVDSDDVLSLGIHNQLKLTDKRSTNALV